MSTPMRLGSAWREVDQRNGVQPPLELLAVSQTRGVVPRDQLTDKPPRADNLNNYKVCAVGDLVLNRFNAYRGALGVAPVRGLASPDYLVLRPNVNHSSRYLEYFLRSSLIASHLKRSMGGLGAADPDSSGFSRIDARALSRLKVHLPTRVDQNRITDYLDCETAKIDALITKQDQLIERLRERRVAQTHALLRDGGGARTRLKRHATVQTGLTLAGTGSAGHEEWPYLRVANVQSGYIDTSVLKLVRASQADADATKIHAGDVLMTEGGDINMLGRGAVWDGRVEPCLHQNHIFAVRPRASLDGDFLALALDGPQARQYFRMNARKTTNLASTNKWTVGNMPLQLPSLQRQREVIERASVAFGRIDAVMAKSEQFITLARERRAALITAAVTGQIDVREAS